MNEEELLACTEGAGFHEIVLAVGETYLLQIPRDGSEKVDYPKMPDGRFPYSNMEVVLEVAEEGSHVVIVVPKKFPEFRLRVALHTFMGGGHQARSLAGEGRVSGGWVREAGGGIGLGGGGVFGGADATRRARCARS